MEDSKPKTNEKIVARVIEDEMKQSYLDYSMSVIVGRALPDVRDGLKPVHRRILYAMNDMGMFHNKPSKKSARIVGEVLGKYHPHGDTAVYDSMVRMAQEWSLRYPLVQGQGNFGSIDGDSAAAMRYTEAKLKKLSEEMLKDIDKDTVKFLPNFDNSLKEPSVLPSKIPNLLVNGSSGIAVGMATNIPPHNMTEICNATIAIIDNQDIEIKELYEIVKGPDFPTGGIICGRSSILNAYKTGRGKLIVRSKTEIEEIKGRNAIIIKEIPYMVNKSETIKDIANQVNDKKLKGIYDIRDESDREGMRVVIELNKDANQDVVLNQLFRHTRLQVTFGIIMLALVDNVPHVLNLKQMLQEFIKHRQIIVRKRTEYELKKAEERKHILEGLIIALDNIDSVIKEIKASKTVEDAKNTLISNYKLTEIQSKSILEMRLQKLASLEQEKIKKEYEELTKLIEKLKTILENEKEILKIIKQELEEIKQSYGDERRTEIIDEEYEAFEEEELIKAEDNVITISHSGYIKRLPVTLYRQQKKGGKGARAASTKDEDFIEEIFVANTHNYILFFTNKGKLHWIKVYQLPESGKQAKGSSISNLLHLSENEKISAFVPVKDFKQGYLMMATKKAAVKKTKLEEFSNPRKGGIIAVNLKEGDELINVVHTNGEDQIILATKNGQAIRFKETDIRPMGRTASGVRGARLKADDLLIDMVKADDSRSLLTITENGFGKRSAVKEYRLISRGGSGVKNIICSERNGKVIAVKSVIDGDDLMFISKNGITIRTPAKDIRVIGRNTQGLRLMRLNAGDKVMAAAKIVKDSNGSENSLENQKDFQKEDNGEENNNSKKDESSSNNA
jgi:DNA gyrase subunit A